MSVIEKLKRAAGTYHGSDINHEGEAYEAVLVVEPVGGGHGVAITFRATDGGSVVFHEEHALVGPSMDGGVSYLPISNNIPFVLPHALVREEGTALVFGAGDVGSDEAFREEITVDIDEERIIYRYSWGLPGGDFAERSSVTLTRRHLGGPPTP